MAFAAALALGFAGVAGAGDAQVARAGEPLSAACSSLNEPFLDGAYGGVSPFTSTFRAGEALTLINDAPDQSLLRAGVADGWPRREFHWNNFISYSFAADAPYQLEWVANAAANWTVTCGESRTAQHFQGYEVDREEPAFSGEHVSVADQFRSGTVYLGDARMLLTPVEARREGHPPAPILRDDVHLKCYRVTGGARLDRVVRAASRYSTTSRLLLKEPNRLCTPTTTTSDGSVVDRPSGWNDYLCYRAEESPRRPEETVELIDQFGGRHAVVRRAEQLCTPVAMEWEGGGTGAPRHPTDDLVCYGIRELEVFDPRRIFVADQFGWQSVRVVDPLVLCVPSTT